MPNLVEKFRAEVGFLWGAKSPPPSPQVTRTQIYPAEDRVITQVLEYGQTNWSRDLERST